MTTTADILQALSGAEAELDDAAAHASGGREHANQVHQQASTRGWEGVAGSMALVIGGFDACLAGFGTALVSVGDARGPVSEIVSGMNPAEVRSRLTTAVAAIERAEEAIAGVYPELDRAESVVKQALDGGQAGPLLRFITLANQATARARQHASAANTTTTGQIPQASALGN
ncbi:DUF6244 family protein [Longispora sp. K20-0274]|uniref:DUF6244 family protein n=1 Tax=Longispora sp. K20-0274 TaxID=3088255 RepID=UPI00399A0537